MKQLSVGFACAIFLSFVFWFHAFSDIHSTGAWDWQFFHQMWEAGYVAITRFGEWPLWNPFHCGGVTIFNNPQSQHFSPFYFLSFLAGPTLGSKLYLVVHTAIGLVGMYVYANKVQGLHPFASFTAAILWSTSGFFAWHGSVGHVGFLPFYFTPWLLFFFEKSLKDTRYCSALATCLAFMVIEGGVYPFAYSILLLSFFSVALLVSRSVHSTQVLRVGVVTALLTFLLGAIRFLPIFHEIQQNPRPMPSLDKLEFSDLILMLTGEYTEWDFENHFYAWHEYGAFIGWGALVFALAGAIVGWQQRKKALVVGAFVFGAFMCGQRSSFYPWAIVHELPVFSSLRVPSRFAVFFVFFLALLAGVALHTCFEWLSKFRLRAGIDWMRLTIPLVVAFGLCLHAFISNQEITDRWHAAPIRSAPKAERFHLVNEPYPANFASYPRRNVGTLECEEGVPVKMGHYQWLGDTPQVKLIGGEGVVEDWGRTSNTMWAKVTVHKWTTLVFNQNWARGWKVNVGKRKAHAGRLAVKLPPGRHFLEASYLPRVLLPSVLLSLLGMGCAVLIARYATQANESKVWECVLRWLRFSRQP